MTETFLHGLFRICSCSRMELGFSANLAGTSARRSRLAGPGRVNQLKIGQSVTEHCRQLHCEADKVSG